MRYRWYPSGTRSSYSAPSPGDLIAWHHAVWRVQSVEQIPEDLWTDDDQRRARVYKAGKGRPVMVVVRPAHITSDDVRARDHDKHLKSSVGSEWHVYPDEHYPICAQCLEPLPCRDEIGRREAERSMKHMERYLSPGVCPSCETVITTRQKSLTFAENLEMPGGPPVTFHVGRSDCRRDAAHYEKRWAALDSANRRTTLSCSGSVVNHNDGTYECSAWANCPGPLAFHPDYRMCNDRECRAKGAFGCTPWPDAKLRQVTS